jgi:hypothetical protein
MVRLFVLYEEEPEAGMYARHVDVCRRAVPGATVRHGRIFGSPQGKPDFAYYFEFEFPDRDAFRAAESGLAQTAEDAQGLGVPFSVYFAEIA